MRTAAMPEGEHELKFHIPKQVTPGFRGWLNQVFIPHRSHAASTICSIYFDTVSGTSLREKVESDFAKTKYRLRWYADEAGVPLPVPAFIEIKERHGSIRKKYRAVLPHSPDDLATTPLEDSMFTEIFQRHRPAHAPAPAARLRPVLELRYLRHRYQHPLFAGSSFCLDSDIRCTRTRTGGFPPGFGTFLPHHVFEQKGRARDPLPVLQALPRFDACRASISKFHQALLHLLPHGGLS